MQKARTRLHQTMKARAPATSLGGPAPAPDNPVELEYAPVTPVMPAEPLEPLAGSSTDAPAAALVGKVVSLLQKAKARNKLAPAFEFLRQRVGLHLPSIGGDKLTDYVFEEARKQVSTTAD